MQQLIGLFLLGFFEPAIQFVAAATAFAYILLESDNENQ